MNLIADKEENSNLYGIITNRTGLHQTQIQGRTANAKTVAFPDLIFETVHPDNPDMNFVFAYMGPDVLANSAMSYLEAFQEVYHRELHQHDFFELLYIIRGEMYQRIENERHIYPEGSLCLLNRNIRHREEFSTDFRTVFLTLPPLLVQELLSGLQTSFFDVEKNMNRKIISRFFHKNLEQNSVSNREYIDFIPTGEDEACKKYMYSLFEQITHHFLNPQIGSTYAIKGSILRIFYELSNPNHYQTVPLNIGTDREAQLFDSITSLMKSRYGRLSRTELENTLGYNGSYLNRIVKKYTGMSLFQYGMVFCMEEAENLLTHTQMRITDICEVLQFSNLTHFYKLFQETHRMTPKEYRQRT